jgi:hypothetical protein
MHIRHPICRYGVLRLRYGWLKCFSKWRLPAGSHQLDGCFYDTRAVVEASELIHRALDSPATAVEDVGIDHRGLHATVPQELLDGPDVITAHEEMGRERMAEGMAGRVLGDSGLARCVVEGSLDRPLVEVMATSFLSGRVVPEARRWEDPLPTPLGRRMGVFPRQGVGDALAPRSSEGRSRANASPSSGALRSRLSRKQAASMVAPSPKGLRRTGIGSHASPTRKRVSVGAPPLWVPWGEGGHKGPPRHPTSTRLGQTLPLPRTSYAFASSSITRPTASAGATSCFSRSRRSDSSTLPSLSDLAPITRRTGMPMRSASLNLTPGRSSRSS